MHHPMCLSVIEPFQGSLYFMHMVSQDSRVAAILRYKMQSLRDRYNPHSPFSHSGTRKRAYPSVFQTSLSMVCLFHSLPLRFRLCWYPIGLSDLAYRMSSPVYRMTSPAPTERLDTSIARQGYEPQYPIYQGLKDRRIGRKSTNHKHRAL